MTPVQLVICLVESAALAVPFWLTCILTANTLRAARSPAWTKLYWYLCVFCLVLAENMLGTIFWGPDHILLYRLALYLLPTATAAWGVSLALNMLRARRQVP